MGFEFVERLELDHDREVWRVRAGDRPFVAYVYQDDERLDRIEAETRTWLGFEHANVTRIEAVERHGERLVIVAGEDRGPTLPEAAAQIAALDERELWAVAQIAAAGDALAGMAARSPGYVHRRIDPRQLLVGPDATVRLRAPIAEPPALPRAGYLGRASRGQGDFRWLASEQAYGKPTTPATDVYHLSALLYATLALRPPFVANSDFAVLEAIVKGPPPPPPPTRTPGLAALIARGMAREPAARFATPAELVLALRACTPADAAPATLARIAAWWPTVATASQAYSAIDTSPCRMTWDSLTPAGDGVRHCGACDQDVVRVTSIGAVLPLLGKRCIAFE